jgi:uncharacterized membrane protein YebE (DUF533 family)
MSILKALANSSRFSLGLALVISSSFSLAQTTATPRIDQRQQNQDTRINNGIASGQLTSAEAARLKARETRIAQLEAAAKADGKVSKSERKEIKQAQNKTSHAIRNQKHDAQRDLNHDGKRDLKAK